MTSTLEHQSAWVKAASTDVSGRTRIIERTHLMRVDGVERLHTVKQQAGPVAGFLDALARGLADRLSKRPEDLRPEDLEGRHGLIHLVDRQLRAISSVAAARALARYPCDDQGRDRFHTALRQRVTARMLSRLSPEFVVASNRLILAEAERLDARVWL